MAKRTDLETLATLIGQAKRLAKRYYDITGRPLGITGEVAEFEACRLLDLEPAEVRQAGWDAITRKPKKLVRFQVKGRCIIGKAKSGARMGKIDLGKDWDAVLLVLLDSQFEATAIYRAERRAVHMALTAPGSKSRNDRGQLALSKFRAIGKLVWERDKPTIS